jgi:hypothetical protein
LRKIVPLVVALIIEPSAHAQGSDSVLYERLTSLSYDVITEYLNGSFCSPGPNLAEKQIALAEAVSKAAPGTGPWVLEIAVMANSLSDVRRLYEEGALALSPWGTLLHTAATYSGPSMLEYLVGEGFELEDAGNASGPVLLAAVTTGNIDNVKWLIANGANVNATDTSGGLVIRHSMICKDQALVDLLLRFGAMPDDKTRELAQQLGISLEPD